MGEVDEDRDAGGGNGVNAGASGAALRLVHDDLHVLATAVGGDEGGGDAFTGEGIGEDTNGGAGGIEAGNDGVGRAALG